MIKIKGHKNLSSYGASPEPEEKPFSSPKVWESRFASGHKYCWEKGKLIIRILNLNNRWEVFQNNKSLGREKDITEAIKIAQNFMSKN